MEEYEGVRLISTCEYLYKTGEPVGQILREFHYDCDGKLFLSKLTKQTNGQEYYRNGKVSAKISEEEIISYTPNGFVSSRERTKKDSLSGKSYYQYQSYVLYDPSNPYLEKEVIRDSEGAGYEETYRKDGTLSSKKRFTNSGLYDQTFYEKDGKTASCSINYSTEQEGLERCFYYKNGKQVRIVERQQDSGGNEYSKIKDGRGNLLGTEETIFGKNDEVKTNIRDAKGKLIKTEVHTGDKNLIIDMKRNKFSAFFDFDRWSFGGKLGKVRWSAPSDDRKTANTQLKGILKDASLSGDKKKTKLRETVAKYREESGVKAPNKKVGEALKKYLPPQKKKGR